MARRKSRSSAVGMRFLVTSTHISLVKHKWRGLQQWTLPRLRILGSSDDSNDV